MSISAWTVGGLAALAVALAASSAMSALLERSSPIRLRHWAEEAGARLRRLYDDPLRFEAFRFLLSAAAKATPLLLLAAAVRALAPVSGGDLAVAAAAVFVLVATAEVWNRLLVGRDPEGALRRLTWAYRLVYAVASPLVAAIAALLPRSAIQRVDGDESPEASDDEIEAYLAVGAREGIFDPGEETLIHRVIDFGDHVVRSVMTPRIDIVAAPTETSLEELAEQFLASNHSRLPLYGESIDDVRGVLHIRDLLGALRSGRGAGAGELAKEPIFVPQTKRLAELLQDMQRSRREMAIVVDEYGGTAGLVTSEDLLEEIVGEIVDEHDEEELPLYRRLPDGSVSVDGKASLATLEELFDVDLEHEPYETVGGLVFGLLGDVPAVGASVESHGLELKVESVGDRRICSLRVAPARAAS